MGDEVLLQLHPVVMQDMGGVVGGGGAGEARGDGGRARARGAGVNICHNLPSIMMANSANLSPVLGYSNDFARLDFQSRGYNVSFRTAIEIVKTI